MANDSTMAAGTRKTADKVGWSSRFILFGAIVLLIVGVVAGGWGMTRLLASGSQGVREVTSAAGSAGSVENSPVPLSGSPSSASGQQPSLVSNPSTPSVNGSVPALLAPSGPLAESFPVDPEALAARVAELEHRLGRISLEAASALGNASRAEGLLIAFAARRALDRGLELGYLENQLRLRFGDTQPNAVTTVIEASRYPVTLDSLRGEIDRLEPELVGRNDGNGSFWTGVRRELAELFVVRPVGSRSPRADERFARVRQHLDAGLVDLAIKEVEAMPGADVATDWLINARRYHEARRALDLIETAAILEPRDRTLPATGEETR